MAFVNLEEAVLRLAAGQVVALPTETVYGLAGRIDREDTLKEIFAVKKRPFFDPLIVHVESLKQAQALTSQWPKVYSLLAEKFWPGSLTLIAPKGPSVSPLITSGLTTVALRCPDHPLFLAALRQLQCPLAAPSANRFGKTSPTQALDVENEFQGHVSVVDGGPCSVGVESTVLQLEAQDKSENDVHLKILRPGGISQTQILNFLKANGYKVEISQVESVASPGHLKAHYQPDSPVVITPSDWAQEKLEREFAKVSAEANISKWNLLSLKSPPEQVARELYQKFREYSKPGQGIWVRAELHTLNSDWAAIWDRLNRAASFDFREA